MDAATIELIKTIATDAIKILGPAIIAALATYKATQRQFEVKLKELEKTHEFGAREHLFSYYKDRQIQLAKDQEHLSRFLGEMLAFATVWAELPDEEESEFLSHMAEYIETYSRIAPTEIETTARDMVRKGLKDADDHKRLIAYLEPIRDLDRSKTPQTLRHNIFTLVEAYHFLQHCNQALLQKQMESVFTKYTDA